MEIKFRKERMLAMMSRLDPAYRQLKEKAAAEGSSAQSSAIKEELEAREKVLWGTYSQMATQFADLHDTPVRMKAKGTIRDIISWSQSRRYFYWRLRLRLKEETIISRFMEADPSLNRSSAFKVLTEVQKELPSSDRQAVEQWHTLEPAIVAEVQRLQTKHAAASLTGMARLARVGLGGQLHGLTAEEAAVRLLCLCCSSADAELVRRPSQHCCRRSMLHKKTTVTHQHSGKRPEGHRGKEHSASHLIELYHSFLGQITYDYTWNEAYLDDTTLNRAYS